MPIELTSSNQELGTPGIQELLGSFSIGNGPYWEFPNPSAGDGRVGGLNVSKFHPIAVQGAVQNLALHVTFSISRLFIPSTTTVRRDNAISVAVTVENFHLTARPQNSQLVISDSGSSVIQSAVSIHRGANNPWNPDRATRLDVPLGLTPAAALVAIDAALTLYDGPYVTSLAQSLDLRMQRKIADKLKVPEEFSTLDVGVTVTFL